MRNLAKPGRGAAPLGIVIFLFIALGTRGTGSAASRSAQAAANAVGAGREKSSTPDIRLPNSKAIFKCKQNLLTTFDPVATHGFDYDEGATPTGDLVADAAGNLYGTTTYGGTDGYGTVFELTPATQNPITYTAHVIHFFLGRGDGQAPYAGLLLDKVTGALYGTTSAGGAGPCFDSGCGTVFELTPENTPGGTTFVERVLYAFRGNHNGAGDGETPLGNLVEDATGALYGTTFGGGTANGGTIFKLARAGSTGYTEQVLHSFGAASASDGTHPASGLIDLSGDFYGTTTVGGTGSCAGGGCGTVFRIAAAKAGYVESVLYNFQGSHSISRDGSNPYAGLLSDSTGDLFGTTYYGGSNEAGCDGASASFPLSSCGTVYELRKSASAYAYSVLYRFQGSIGGGDGANPYGDLVSEGGTLYGTTTYGGSSMACSVTTSFGTVLGCGTVFSLNARNNVAIFSFTGGANGQSPQGGLLLNRSGAFFGTTAIGGVGTACSPPSSGGGGCGVAFELLPLPSNLAPAIRWATPRS